MILETERLILRPVLMEDAEDIFEYAKDLYQVLSDSFFVPAVVITGFGLLIFASNEGAFDGISYGVKAFLGMFKSKQEKKYKSLYEYKEQKARELLGYVKGTTARYKNHSTTRNIKNKNMLLKQKQNSF